MAAAQIIMQQHLAGPAATSVDPPEWAAAAAENLPLDHALVVVTFNVWFGALGFDERAGALILEVLRTGASVVCLQEVTPRFAALLKSSQIITDLFVISHNAIRGYGVLMLVRKVYQPVFSEHELPSNMGRSLLVAQLRPTEDNLAWCAGSYATVHLESMASARMRKRQLEVARKTLARFPNAVLCGDFNFDDTQEYGDWRLAGGAAGGPSTGDGATARAPETLENNVLATALGADWIDSWRELRPTEEGKTFDGATNPVCVRDPQERMRYDRVMIRSRKSRCLGGGAAHQWHLQNIRMIGTEPINSQNLKMSDHYGLAVTIGDVCRDHLTSRREHATEK